MKTLSPVERPILFSTPMVQALLDDSKTQTRRILKQPRRKDGAKILPELLRDIGIGAACPYGQVGDRLWVRETWGLSKLWDDATKEDVRKLAGYRSHIRYRAGPGPKPSGKLRPSIFMPRAGSRILLEITGLGLEPLTEISANDAIAEGLTEAPAVDETTYGVNGGRDWFSDPRDAYRALWESINGAGSWADNPWVWVLTFKRLPR